MDLTHFDQDGNAWMVDVSDKDITTRTAVAEGFIAINDAIYERIEAGTIKKAKQTSNLIPLCHPLALTKVEVHCTLVDGESPACTDATHNRAVKVRATVKTTGKTGVEMEALTAVQVGLLTVYDMCKAIDKGMIIGPTYLVEKEGGKSGHFVRSFVE